MSETGAVLPDVSEGREGTRLPEGMGIHEREVQFDYPVAPRYWMRGDPALTHFMYALSLLFPEGERFFVAAVQRYRDRIHDPRLAEQVEGFLKQEGAHSRQHTLYNQRLTDFGIDVARIERIMARAFKIARHHLSPMTQLALTTAIEHFTAMMAAELLRDERYLEGAAPEHAALWRWHAAEEIEHKAVAFDVYQLVGGGYLRRVLTMLYITLDFGISLFVVWSMLLYRDGELFRPRSWISALRFSLFRPGFVVHMIRPWLAWFRPSFHPWRRDDSALVREWRATRTP